MKVLVVFPSDDCVCTPGAILYESIHTRAVMQVALEPQCFKEVSSRDYKTSKYLGVCKGWLMPDLSTTGQLGHH